MCNSSKLLLSAFLDMPFFGFVWEFTDILLLSFLPGEGVQASLPAVIHLLCAMNRRKDAMI